jgi:glycosyltransferase involved in cell wall biosynthesis
MVRILTLTSWYPPHHYGGYELSCYDVMTRLVARGHSVRVLCGDELLPTAAPPDAEHERLVFRELRAHWREGSDWRPSLRETVAIERHNHRVLERHLDEFRPDVVSVWHMVAISAGLLRHLSDRGIPVVDVVCDHWPVYVEHFDAWTSRFSGNPLKAWSGRVAEAVTGLPTTAGDFTEHDVFCFVSEATRRRALDARPWSYPISTVVFSGIERTHFPARREREQARRGRRLLYVGRLDATKGVDTLVRALPELPADATLTCYGRGAELERARLGRLAESLGVAARVTFGSLEREELAAAYAAADVVVFPSEWQEPFGLVPLEAMACGTPVIATGVGGSSEFLRDGYNCVLFAAGDAHALAAAVRRLHDDTTLHDAVVRGGFATAAQLDVSELANTLEAWHVATASRFRDGRPADRRLDLPPGPITTPTNDPLANDPLAWPPPEVREALATLAARSGGQRGTRRLVAAETDDRARAVFTRNGADAVRLYGEPVRGREAHHPAVVAACESLPFRSDAFDFVAGDGLFERARDDHAAVREIGRVVRPGAVALFAAANRCDVFLRWARIRDRLAGLRTPARAYVHDPKHRREYSGTEIETLLGDIATVRAHRTVGWKRGRKRRAVGVVLRGLRLARFAQATVIEAECR